LDVDADSRDEIAEIGQLRDCRVGEVGRQEKGDGKDEYDGAAGSARMHCTGDVVIRHGPLSSAIFSIDPGSNHPAVSRAQLN